MRHFIELTCVFVVLISGCSKPSADLAPVPNPLLAKEHVSGTPYGDYVLGEPVSHENLTIFPISSRQPKNVDRFITLDEGITAGSVKIIEVGADEGEANDAASDPQIDSQANESLSQVAQTTENQGPTDQLQSDGQVSDDDDLFGPAVQDSQAQNDIHASAEGDAEMDDLFGPGEVDGEVNTLMVHNTSGKPLYLMPGEVISGGKQDRTIGQEIVIAPSDKPVPIDVFCVEHGRWEGRSIEGTTAQLAEAREFSPNLSLVVSETAAVDELAKEARKGKFIASVGYLSKDARMAVQEKGEQSKVWEEVANTNSKLGNDSASGNFAESYLSANVAKDFEPFIEKLKPTGETNLVVGVAVAVNGKMLSVDIFESTPLFRKLWPKLLKSYALDAVSAKSEEDSSKALTAMTVNDCVVFLRDVDKSEAETKELSDGQKLATRQSEKGISFSYYDTESAKAAGAPNDAGAMGGGFGGAGYGGSVHTSVLAK